MARREKKPVHKVVMTEGKRNIIQQLLQEYDIETAEDIQDVLKDLLGGTIKELSRIEPYVSKSIQSNEKDTSFTKIHLKNLYFYIIIFPSRFVSTFFFVSSVASA